MELEEQLRKASKEGNIRVVKKLLHHGVYVDGSDQYGRSSLMVASENGHKAVVKNLLSAGANVDLQDEDGRSSLMVASENGCEEVVKILLSACAKVDLQDELDGQSSLICASENGHEQVVKMLLLAGAKVNLQYKNGWSSLMVASEKGQEEVVKMLLPAGADIDLQDEHGWSSLMSASENGHEEVVKMLLSAGAKVDLQDEYGRSSLMLASGTGYEEVVKMLLSVGAKVNLQSKDGNTALHKAAEGGHGDCVRLLLSTPGINNNHVNGKGRTPLMLATDYDVLTLLQKYTTSCEDFPVHTYGKVIMCGDSGAGKSTLTEVIKYCTASTREGGIDESSTTEGGIDESSTREGAIDESSTSEDGIDEPLARIKARKSYKSMTAGIIAHPIKSSKANMTIYDLAGHREYYSSHSSILELISNTTPSVFLLLVNLILTLKEITAQVYYWSAMIGNVCNKCPQQSSIIVVGTHADCVADKRKLQLSSQIEQVARDAIKHHIFVQFTALNATSLHGAALNSFMSLLHCIIDDVRVKCPALSLSCHVMYAFLNDKVPANQDAITLSQLLILLNQEDPKILPTEAAEVSVVLKTLSEKGFIVFFDANPADSWIVLHQDTLLEKVNGVLFAPANFDEHLPIASNTGVIPISVLKRHFPEPEYNINMITQFLIRFELCQPITLAPINTFHQMPPTSPCPDLFFPPLVNAIRPDDVIICDKAFQWQICTININQSFSPRFLHVLVSRIADQFPLPTVEPCLVPDLKPYNRSCTVWRRGISWMSKEGFITIIEMREDFQCLLCAVSTSDKTNLKYSKLVLFVINVIKKACDEFCSSVSRVEMITCPPEATSDHVAVAVEYEALKEIIANDLTQMADSTRKKVVNINVWRELEPQLSSLVDVELKHDATTNAIAILLDAGDHAEISRSTKSASDQWRAIGGKLGFTFVELDSIVHEDGRYGEVDYYEAMLKRWLDWAPPTHPTPSLQCLLSALRDVGKERLAYDLEAKYRK